MCIGSLGGSKSPAPPPPVVAPPPVVDNTQSNTASDKARADQAAKAKRAGGMASTIQTSPLGVEGAATTQKPSLLGFTQPPQ